MKQNINNLLNNINGYPLDNNQKNIVLSKAKYLLVSAGAGSGKTLTIIGKIRYLVEIEKIKEDEIICISFTNESTNSLKNKLKEIYNYDIPCYTFHKLGLEILKNSYSIASSDALKYTLNEFFSTLVYNEKNLIKIVKIITKKKLILNYKKAYKSIKQEEIDILKRLIHRFISLFKANDYKPKDFILFLKRSNEKEQELLLLIFSIYYIYEKELLSKKEIDFNDMITKATEEVLENDYKKRIKYIIIDEFQDTSLVRFNLIKAILKSTNANLLVVGDDFQSIYHFTGCDLSIFLNFKEYFKDGKILKIENTYRNSQELIDIGGSFIMKDKNQLIKNLKSSKNIDKPIIIVYYKNLFKVFTKIIEKIYNESKKPILILGRNNFDIDEILESNLFYREENNIIYKNNLDIKLTYLTVHKSKGLEEENVIVLNMLNKKLGFPNKIIDENILRFVSYPEDSYPFAEERRLFYVAITRTKNRCFLLTKKNMESEFIKELKKDYKNNIEIWYN